MSSGGIFRFFNPDGPKEDPVQRRRGQLRRAQRSYRDRKERYIKLLETELAQTRASEANLMQDCERLRENLKNAVTLLNLHGIDHSQLVLDSHTPQEQLVSHNGQNNFSPNSLDGSQSHSVPGSETFVSSTSPNSLDQNLGISTGNLATLSVREGERATDWPLGPGSYSTRVGEMDQVEVGMEFVLQIEEPCRGHLHGDLSKPDDPSGHALTATHHLVSVPSCRASPSGPGEAFIVASAVPRPLFQNAPRAVLERLLSLSPDLSADGEITPVQAWNAIRQQPQYGGLDIQRLRRLGDELRDAVKCHGFGAVVKKSIFDRLVHETIRVG